MLCESSRPSNPGKGGHSGAPRLYTAPRGWNARRNCRHPAHLRERSPLAHTLHRSLNTSKPCSGNMGTVLRSLSLPPRNRTPMSVRNTVKSIQDLMRRDSGVDGDAQRLGQLCWMCFLKIIDDQDRALEQQDSTYRSPVPLPLRWRTWAAPPDGPSGDVLLTFVSDELFPKLKNLSDTRKNSTLRARNAAHPLVQAPDGPTAPAHRASIGSACEGGGGESQVIFVNPDRVIPKGSWLLRCVTFVWHRCTRINAESTWILREARRTTFPYLVLEHRSGRRTWRSLRMCCP
jgi:hypothetical protein